MFERERGGVAFSAALGGGWGGGRVRGVPDAEAGGVVDVVVG